MLLNIASTNKVFNSWYLKILTLYLPTNAYAVIDRPRNIPSLEFLIFSTIIVIHTLRYVACNVNRMTESHKNATFAPQLRHSMPHVDRSDEDPPELNGYESHLLKIENRSGGRVAGRNDGSGREELQLTGSHRPSGKYGDVTVADITWPSSMA